MDGPVLRLGPSLAGAAAVAGRMGARQLGMSGTGSAPWLQPEPLTLRKPSRRSDVAASAGVPC